jgi:hypothetical protein
MATARLERAFLLREEPRLLYSSRPGARAGASRRLARPGITLAAASDWM